MDKKNRNARNSKSTSTKKSVDTPSTVVADSTPNTVSSETESKEQDVMNTDNTDTAAENTTPAAATNNEPRDITASYVRTSKFGNVIYRIDGIRGTVAISKSMFAKEPYPKTVTLSSVPFVLPGQSARVSSPERQKKLAEKLAKAEERAKKTAERLAKLRKQAGVKEPEQAPLPTEPATETTEAPATV